MIKIELSPNQVHDLLTILGAAKPLFDDLANKPETLGIFKAVINDWSQGCEDFIKIFTEQHNEQVK